MPPLQAPSSRLPQSLSSPRAISNGWLGGGIKLRTRDVVVADLAHRRKAATRAKEAVAGSRRQRRRILRARQGNCCGGSRAPPWSSRICLLCLCFPSVPRKLFGPCSFLQFPVEVHHRGDLLFLYAVPPQRRGLALLWRSRTVGFFFLCTMQAMRGELCATEFRKFMS